MRQFRAVPVIIKLNEAKDAASVVPEKVQILRTGTFHDDRYGIFQITKDILAKMKVNFDSNARRIELAIDYKHASEDVAAGWIKSLELSEDGQELWAEVAWTPNGKKVLSDKEFRYLSADFSFDYEDNETREKFGPTLFGAGLTNRPVVKAMAPTVELNEGKGPAMDPKDQKIAELEAKIADLQKQAGGDKGAGDSSTEMADLKKQLADMQQKCADYEAAAKKAGEEKALAEKKAKFDKMLSEGKAVEAQREPYMKGDSDKFMELAEPVKLKEQGHGAEGGADGGKSAQDQILELAEKHAKENKCDKPTALLAVLKANPKLAEKC